MAARCSSKAPIPRHRRFHRSAARAHKVARRAGSRGIGLATARSYSYAMDPTDRPCSVLRRTGFHHLPGLGARPVRSCRDSGFRLCAAPRRRTGRPSEHLGKATRLCALDGASWYGSCAVARRSQTDRRYGADRRHPDRNGKERASHDLRAGPQPFLFTAAAALAYRRGMHATWWAACARPTIPATPIAATTRFKATAACASSRHGHANSSSTRR